MRLIVYTRNGPVGTITYENGQLIGSTPALQATADVKVRVFGSPKAAFEMLRGSFNGYVHFKPEEDGPGSIWD